LAPTEERPRTGSIGFDPTVGGRVVAVPLGIRCWDLGTTRLRPGELEAGSSPCCGGRTRPTTAHRARGELRVNRGWQRFAQLRRGDARILRLVGVVRRCCCNVRSRQPMPCDCRRSQNPIDIASCRRRAREPERTMPQTKSLARHPRRRQGPTSSDSVRERSRRLMPCAAANPARSSGLSATDR
jgi:hypothetical protein